MNEYLEILDEIEEIRQRAAEKPTSYSVDYVVRLCEAIVSEHAGYQGREEWTKALKQSVESKYSCRMAEGRIHL